MRHRVSLLKNVNLLIKNLLVGDSHRLQLETRYHFMKGIIEHLKHILTISVVKFFELGIWFVLGDLSKDL